VGPGVTCQDTIEETATTAFLGPVEDEFENKLEGREGEVGEVGVPDGLEADGEGGVGVAGGTEGGKGRGGCRENWGWGGGTRVSHGESYRVMQRVRMRCM
jgi:hypothetical protein